MLRRQVPCTGESLHGYAFRRASWYGVGGFLRSPDFGRKIEEKGKGGGHAKADHPPQYHPETRPSYRVFNKLRNTDPERSRRISSRLRSSRLQSSIICLWTPFVCQRDLWPEGQTILRRGCNTPASRQFAHFHRVATCRPYFVVPGDPAVSGNRAMSIRPKGRNLRTMKPLQDNRSPVDIKPPDRSRRVRR